MPSGVYKRKKPCNNGLLGKHWKLSEETKKRMSSAKIGKPIEWATGKNNYRWIEDRSMVKRQDERNNPNDKQWKLSVYKRDNFQCMVKNSECSGKIEAHHILSWRQHKDLRFVVSNGITLCHYHHPRKRSEEESLIDYFNTLISKI